MIGTGISPHCDDLDGRAARSGLLVVQRVDRNGERRASSRSRRIRAAAAAPEDPALSFEQGERPAHRGARHAEALHELGLAGQRAGEIEIAVAQGLCKDRVELLIAGNARGQIVRQDSTTSTHAQVFSEFLLKAERALTLHDAHEPERIACLIIWTPSMRNASWARTAASFRCTAYETAKGWRRRCADAQVLQRRRCSALDRSRERPQQSPPRCAP